MYIYVYINNSDFKRELFETLPNAKCQRILNLESLCGWASSIVRERIQFCHFDLPTWNCKENEGKYSE